MSLSTQLNECCHIYTAMWPAPQSRYRTYPPDIEISLRPSSCQSPQATTVLNFIIVYLFDPTPGFHINGLLLSGFFPSTYWIFLVIFVMYFFLIAD